jgi:hypothetical protein
VTRVQSADGEWEFVEPYLPIGEYGPYPEWLRQQSAGQAVPRSLVLVFCRLAPLDTRSAGAGCVLVCLPHGGVHRDVPADLSRRVGHSGDPLQRRSQVPRPQPVALVDVFQGPNRLGRSRHCPRSAPGAGSRQSPAGDRATGRGDHCSPAGTHPLAPTPRPTDHRVLPASCTEQRAIKRQSTIGRTAPKEAVSVGGPGRVLCVRPAAQSRFQRPAQGTDMPVHHVDRIGRWLVVHRTSTASLSVTGARSSRGSRPSLLGPQTQSSGPCQGRRVTQDPCVAVRRSDDRPASWKASSRSASPSEK